MYHGYSGWMRGYVVGWVCTYVLGSDKGSRGKVDVVVGDGGVVDSGNAHGVSSVELSTCTKGEVEVVECDDVGNTLHDDIKDVTKDALKVEQVEGSVGVAVGVGFSRVNDCVSHVAKGGCKGVECGLVVIDEASHRARDVNGGVSRDRGDVDSDGCRRGLVG